MRCIVCTGKRFVLLLFVSVDWLFDINTPVWGDCYAWNRAKILVAYILQRFYHPAGAGVYFNCMYRLLFMIYDKEFKDQTNNNDGMLTIISPKFRHRALKETVVYGTVR